jgi:hypothetical protein
VKIFCRWLYAGFILKNMVKGVLLFSGIIGLGAFLFLYPIWVLTLTKNYQIIFLRSVKPGDTFQLAYLHSVALSDVRDFLLIDSEYRIVLTETRFQGQGTGLPYNIAKGEKLLREGDWFRLTGMQRVVPSIFWRVQSQWHDRFRFGNEPELNISAQVEEGLVHIQVQKVNIAAWLGMYFYGTVNSLE